MPRWLILSLALLSLAALLGAAVVSSVGVFILAVLLYLVDGTLLAVWTWQDMKGAGSPSYLWTAMVFFFWPAAVPARVLMSRKTAGLLPAAGVFLAFLILPAAFVGAVVKQMVLMESYRKTARTILKDTKGVDKEKAEQAMEAMRKALASYDLEWSDSVLYARAAILAGKPEAAASAYRKLRKAANYPLRSSKDRFECLSAAMRIQTLLASSNMGSFMSGMADPEASGIFDVLRAYTQNYEESLNVKKECELAYSALDPQQQQMQSKRMDIVRAYPDSGSEPFYRFAVNLLPKVEGSPDWRQAVSSFFQAVNRLEAKKDPIGAEGLFIKAVTLRRDFGDAHLELARICLNQNRNDFASASARTAIALFEKDGPVLTAYPKKVMLSDAHAIYGITLLRESRVRMRSKDPKKRQSAKAFAKAANAEFSQAMASNPKSALVKQYMKEMMTLPVDMLPAGKVRQKKR